ncbi:hypothetical protein ACIRPT_16000 [Streptomyces sp. NPDC101227]|uniref:hypothetical protein n=1 Tax=Streptomyces sp. NPDC101227 TaxID=3366136 RepID=UPI00380D3DCB
MQPRCRSHTIHQDPSDPHAYNGDNALLSGLDAAALRRVAALSGPAAPMMVVVQLRHLGGALAGDSATGAVGHRAARFALSVLSPTDGAELPTVRALHDEALAAVAPWRIGRNVNFLFGEQRTRTDAAEVARSLHGADLHRRLTDLRAAHDPGNLFRFHPFAGGANHTSDAR